MLGGQKVTSKFDNLKEEILILVCVTTANPVEQLWKVLAVIDLSKKWAVFQLIIKVSYLCNTNN